MPRTASGADPMIWGHGPTTLEIFAEPTCPFSKIAFEKIEPLIDHMSADAITVKIRFLSQPWHLFSAVVTRAILAATTLDEGKEAGRKVMKAVGDNREEFVCEEHCKGPHFARSLKDTVARISQLSGFDLATAFETTGLEKEIKWHAKYSRQMGAHMTPSFAIDGLMNDKMSSAGSIQDWAALLGQVKST